VIIIVRAHRTTNHMRISLTEKTLQSQAITLKTTQKSTAVSNQQVRTTHNQEINLLNITVRSTLTKPKTPSKAKAAIKRHRQLVIHKDLNV